MRIPAWKFWKKHNRFQGMLFHSGRCNVCGNQTRFFYTDPALYRESLICENCLTSSRYRSIARGVLKAIQEITEISAPSLTELQPTVEHISFSVYDTQHPFYWYTSAYPIPDLLSRCKWITRETSVYRTDKPLGFRLRSHFTNQNLENLSFADNSFDVVITSDVMEHVRLDNKAHEEIRRVLKPGGVYLFTVPHFRHQRETIVRVKVVDPADPTKDQFLMEKEYHGDTNSGDHKSLSYRSYGTEVDEFLSGLGFTVEYNNQDFPEVGILNTELFFCRLSK